MLTLSSPTAIAAALHANEGAWIMFLQSDTSIDAYGPIKIDSATGPQQLADRLTVLSAVCPYDLRLIGLVQTENAASDIEALATTFAACHLHDLWFAPCTELIALIAERAQDAITALLPQTHPGALSDVPVDIEEIARIIGVSVPTVRRMVKAAEIPFLKWGRIYRFVPADVIASLRNR